MSLAEAPAFTPAQGARWLRLATLIEEKPRFTVQTVAEQIAAALNAGGCTCRVDLEPLRLGAPAQSVDLRPLARQRRTLGVVLVVGRGIRSVVSKARLVFAQAREPVVDLAPPFIEHPLGPCGIHPSTLAPTADIGSAAGSGP